MASQPDAARECEARRQEIIDAYDAWQAEICAVQDAVGFTAASDAEDSAAAAWIAADKALNLYQPSTLAALTRKAQWVAARLSNGGCNDDLGEIFARQVVVAVGHQREVDAS